MLRKLSANPAATKHLYLVAQAYAPLPEGSYAWDVYTPAKVFFGGEGPERVEWRVWRFDVKDIPGIRDAVMDEEEDGISMPRPEHPERQGLRNRAGRPRAGAWQDSIGTEHPTPSLEITSHDAEPPVDPVEPEPVTAEQENGDRGRNLSSPPDRSRSLSPSSAHNLPTEEARRLDQFAAWLNDRWLQIDNAMINYSASGSFGSDVLVNDLKITGSQNPKLQRDEIGCTPSLTDLISLLLAVLAVYYPLITGLAWLGFTVFWQVVGFFVVVFGVTAAGWAVGILG